MSVTADGNGHRDRQPPGHRELVRRVVAGAPLGPGDLGRLAAPGIPAVVRRALLGRPDLPAGVVRDLLGAVDGPEAVVAVARLAPGLVRDALAGMDPSDIDGWVSVLVSVPEGAVVAVLDTWADHCGDPEVPARAVALGWADPAPLAHHPLVPPAIRAVAALRAGYRPQAVTDLAASPTVGPHPVRPPWVADLLVRYDPYLSQVLVRLDATLIPRVAAHPDLPGEVAHWLVATAGPPAAAAVLTNPLADEGLLDRARAVTPDTPAARIRAAAGMWRPPQGRPLEWRDPLVVDTVARLVALNPDSPVATRVGLNPRIRDRVGALDAGAATELDRVLARTGTPPAPLDPWGDPDLSPVGLFDPRMRLGDIPPPLIGPVVAALVRAAAHRPPDRWWVALGDPATPVGDLLVPPPPGT